MTTDTDQLAVSLAEASSVVEMRAVAVSLSKPGLTARASRHPAYRHSLERLRGLVRQGAPVDRLVALSILARLRKQQNRPFDPHFEDALRERMDALEAPAEALEDAKERDYLAQGLRLVDFTGRVDYLARFVASEGQTRTDARDTSAQVLLEAAATLDEVFQALTDPLERQSHDTQDPATSRLRRLIRVVEALRSALRHIEPAVTPRTGSAYARLLQTSLSRSAERSVSIEATNAALDLLLAWLRPNFSAALDPDAFSGLRFLRSQFAPARWPDETMEARQAVAKLIKEAIALLGQAGVTDDRLRKALEVALDAMSAAAMLRRLAKEQAGLGNDVRLWLETGKAQEGLPTGAAVSESVLETVDRDLAEAFREGDATMRLLEGVSGDIGEAILLANPAISDAYGELLQRVGRLTRRIESIAAKRGFQLEGNAGTVVEYAPSDHVANRPIAGVRNVRIVSPMVVRLTSGGAPQIITKARVEEA